MNRLTRSLALVLVAAAAAVANAGWWDDAGAARRTTLDEVRKDADRWRDVTIVLDVKFAAVAEPGNPYFTRFTPKEWRAVAVYAADATPETMSSAEPFALLFVRRGSDGETRLGAFAKGRRVQLRATVRDAVKGEPWIEVLDVVTDGDPLTPEEEAMLARGEQLLLHENPAGAETVLRGLAGKRVLPKAVQADLWRKIGAACWAQRRFSETADAYAAALAAEPEDRATATKLAAAKAAAAAAASESAAPASVASIAPSSPAPPASFGTPVAPTPRRLLPPVGIPEAAAPAAPAPAPAGTPAPPADDPAPAAPSKPKLAGPK